MDDTLQLDASVVDYVLVAAYFAVVLGIGFAARRRVSDSLDFFLSGRSLPAWVTGLAFISANLGAVEIVGMSANGAQFGSQVGYPDRSVNVQRPQDRVSAFSGEHGNAQYQTDFLDLAQFAGFSLLVFGCF